MVPATPASDDASLFDACIARIEAEYVRLGHTDGWRFLYGPRRVLDGPVDIALVTLNPGGDTTTDAHPRASCEDVLAFVGERWGDAPAGAARLQRQFQGLFDALAATSAFDGPAGPRSGTALMAASALASLVPFRSATFDRLPAGADSVAFGISLWRALLPRLRPRLVVVLGREVQRVFRTLLPETLDVRAASRTRYPTGWGRFDVELDTFAGADHRVRMLYLPHLSRFSLFTRTECRPCVTTFIDAATRDG